MENYILPDRRLFRDKLGYDWKPLMIQTIRGCLYNCAYCALPNAHGKTPRIRSVKSIIEEIETNMEFDELFITEDILLLPDEDIEKFAEELFTELIRIKYDKEIFLMCSLLLTKKKRLLDLAYQAGVKTVYLVMGFDPVSVKAVSHDMPEEAEEAIRAFQGAGIEIFAAVGIGLEADDKTIFNKHLDFLTRNNIRLAEFWILTPFPGTPMWRKYNRQGRIINRDFDYYNGAHTVFRPKKMTANELDDGFIYLWKEFFTRFPLTPEEAIKYHNLTDEYHEKNQIQKKDKKQIVL